MGKLNAKQILETLERQLLYGKTYLSIACALREAEPTVTGAAPTFFGLMSEGGFVMAQMSLARLYDKHLGVRHAFDARYNNVGNRAASYA